MTEELNLTLPKRESATQNPRRNFEKFATTASEDATTRDKEGEVSACYEPGGFTAGIGTLQEIEEMLFKAAPGDWIKTPVETDQRVHVLNVREKVATRQKSFHEARARVARDLRARKETEVRESLLSKLREQYDVVIHRAAFHGTNGENETETQ